MLHFKQNQSQTTELIPLNTAWTSLFVTDLTVIFYRVFTNSSVIYFQQLAIFLNPIISNLCYVNQFFFPLGAQMVVLYCLKN